MAFPSDSLTTSECLYHLTEEFDYEKKLQNILNKDPSTLSILVLNHLIASRIEIDQLQKCIKNHKKNYQNLDLKTFRYGLAPAHVAVIAKNTTALEALLKEGADPNIKDRKDWTPAHHASLICDEAALKILKEYKASFSEINVQEGTPEDIARLTTLKTDEDSLPVLITDKNNQLQQATQKTFKDLTGAHYIFDFYVPKTVMIESWKKPLCKKSSLNPLFFSEFQSKYFEFFANQSLSYIIKHVTVDSVGTQLVASPKLGLFAAKSYKKKEIVDHYVGEIKENLGKNANISEFFLEGDVDAQQFGSAVSRSNDGFPNMVMIELEHCKGWDRAILVACEDIKEGEELCWNYGYQSIKLGPYTELRPDALRNFVKKTDLNLLKEKIKKPNLASLTFEEYVELEKFRYLLSTPSAFYFLIFEEVLSENQAEELYSLAYMLTHKKVDNPSLEDKILKPLVSITLETFTIYQQIKQVSQLDAEEYFQFFRNLICEKGIVKTLKLNQLINPLFVRFLKRNKPSNKTFLQDWKLIFEAMKQSCLKVFKEEKK